VTTLGRKTVKDNITKDRTFNRASTRFL